MPSFGELVEEVIGLLNDWTGQQPQVCTLTAELPPGGTTMVVDDGMALVRGLMEVDEELVYVKSFDQASGNATVPVWGRGQQSTAETGHAVGARVTATPRPPRDRVKKRINQVVTGMFPDLWAVGTVDLVAEVREEYPVPAGARWIVDAQWQTLGAVQEWTRVRAWRINQSADPADFPSGVSVTIPAVPFGQPIRLVYAGEPQPMVNAADDFAATTGLHAGVADMVVLATAAQLVLGQELSRAQLSTMEQQQRAEKIQTGATLAASRFLTQQYQLRLSAERRRLLAAHPSRPHFEGV